MSLTKKFFHYFLRGFVLLVLVSLLLPQKIHAPAYATSEGTFLKKQGTGFVLNGQPYRFVGVNAYQLGTLWGTNAGCGSQVNDLDTFFSSLPKQSVVRLWAFQGSIGTNVLTKQTDFSGIDRVIAAATRNNQKLILVFAGQSGTCDDGHWKDPDWYRGGYTRSYNDDGRGLAPLSYLTYVKLLVSRYKDNPTIAMWEPVSEPEASECAPGDSADSCYLHSWCADQTAGAQALRSFFDTVGGEIKKIDPNHLISSGVMGGSQCGVNDEHYSYIHQSQGIDVASYHDYEPGNKPMPGDQWTGLQRRLTQMKGINKPLIVGEVGINAATNATNCLSLTTRRDLMKAKMDAQFKAGIAGFLPWNWQHTSTGSCNHDYTSSDALFTLLKNYSLAVPTHTPTPTTQTPQVTPTTLPTINPTPTPTSISTPTPTTVTKLGGLDLTRYCSSLDLFSPTYETGNWTCGPTGQNINLSSVCIWQYNDPRAYAKQDISGNQYSWTCYK